MRSRRPALARLIAAVLALAAALTGVGVAGHVMAPVLIIHR